LRRARGSVGSKAPRAGALPAARALEWLPGDGEDDGRERFGEVVTGPAGQRPPVLSTWMDQATDGLFVSDALGFYVEVNLRGCQMLGRTREQVIGLNVRDIVHPDDAQQRAVDLTKIGTGVTFLSERRLVRRDGSSFLAEVSTTRLDDGRYLAIVRDVTAKRAAEEAPRRAEASFRALLDVLPALVVVHREGVIVYANATAAKACGCSGPAELVGSRVIELVYPDDRAMVAGRIRRMVETGAPEALERERFLRRDGTHFEAEVVALPLVFDGKPSLLAVATDATESAKLRAQLIQSDRLASIGLLAAGVAHEINNPLTYVLPNLERLAQGLGSPSPDLAGLQDNVRGALDGVRRVQKIVRDLSTFARDARGDDTATDVNAAVASALLLAEGELRFRTRVTRDLTARSKVRANEGRLVQVLLNLAVNAAHAIPEGDASAHEVRITTRDAPGEVRITVRDTGEGIAAEHLPRLFDPFFTTKAPGSGSGLGLSVCHSIVTSFGGRIEVDSTRGEGSAFTVVLPAVVATAPPPIAQPSPSQPLSGERSARPRLLLVDDERNVRDVLQALLKRRYEVAAAASVAEARQRLTESGDWQIILCDLMMPEATGMDLYDWVAQECPALASRMVFMTGGAFTTRARELLDRLPDRWIEKPFEFDQLIALLDRLSDAQGPAAQALPA
jgi:two-component system cell cycle sensor histidine kinase/response regulator CckA